LLFLLGWPIVWVAGWIVPRPKRSEWRSRRRKVLWHWCAFLVERGGVSLQSKLEISANCWAAFPEALWIRFDRERTLSRLERLLRSPGFALAVAAFLLVLVIVGSGFLPITRSLLGAPPYWHPEELANVSSTWLFAPGRAGVPSNWAELWAQAQSIQSVAQYSWTEAVASVGAGPSHPALLGQVSPNFFQVLGVGTAAGRTFQPSDDTSCLNCVLLSYPLAKRIFGNPFSAVGRSVFINGASMTVVGVLPARFWFLSHAETVWSVMPRENPPILVKIGAITQQLTPSRIPKIVGMMVRTKPGSSINGVTAELRTLAQGTSPRRLAQLELLPIRSKIRQTVYPFVALVVAALLLAAVLASFRLRGRIPATQPWRWWCFFYGRVVLLLAVAALGTIEGTALLLRFMPGDPFAWLVSTWVCLILVIAAVLWCTGDQSYRCRVCLFRLAHPLTVGNPQRVLLDRGATELVCSEGHGLLHISAPTSWDETEQWNRFDSSWKTLFGSDEE
jgi:hypothetical protein